MLSQAAWTNWDLTKWKASWTKFWNLLAFRTLLALTGICLSQVELKDDPQWKLYGKKDTISFILSGDNTAGDTGGSIAKCSWLYWTSWSMRCKKQHTQGIPTPPIQFSRVSQKQWRQKTCKLHTERVYPFGKFLFFSLYFSCRFEYDKGSFVHSQSTLFLWLK